MIVEQNEEYYVLNSFVREAAQIYFVETSIFQNIIRQKGLDQHLESNIDHSIEKMELFVESFEKKPFLPYYTKLASLYEKKDFLQKANDILQKALEINEKNKHSHNYKKNAIFIYSGLMAVSKTFADAKFFFFQMKERNLRPNEISYSTLINKSESFADAKFFFQEMKDANLRLDEISYSTLINKSESFADAKFFFQEMKNANLRLDQISYSTLINKSESFADAKFFFQEMKDANLRPNEISYSTLINKSESFADAKFFFQEMKNANLRLDQITFNTILRKASQENRYEAILELLSEMRQMRVKPQIQTGKQYTINAIKSCIQKNRKRFLDWSKAQNWQEACWQEFFKNFS